MFIFVGYPRGTKGYFFCSSSNNKVFVSTHVTFLEDDYMRNFKPKSRFFKKKFEEKVILDVFHKKKLKDYLRISCPT